MGTWGSGPSLRGHRQATLPRSLTSGLHPASHCPQPAPLGSTLGPSWPSGPWRGRGPEGLAVSQACSVGRRPQGPCGLVEHRPRQGLCAQYATGCEWGPRTLLSAPGCRHCRYRHWGRPGHEPSALRAPVTLHLRASAAPPPRGAPHPPVLTCCPHILPPSPAGDPKTLQMHRLP